MLRTVISMVRMFREMGLLFQLISFVFIFYIITVYWFPAFLESLSQFFSFKNFLRYLFEQ